MNSLSHFLRRLGRYQTILLLLLVTFACWQCANPIAPTGGPRDEQPPRVDSLRSTPNLQTNFYPATIQLTFDEWIKLEQANQQVVISPPLQGYKVSLKGKSVIVDFGDQDTLRENVTYVIQFGEAVKDLTESNPAENLRFVFSTGPYIDSLEVQGQVIDAYTSEPVEGALVMLYDNLADSVFRTEKPFYFGRTNEEGLFLISNLRAGNYKLTALKDGDANYRYNQASEAIAFFSEPINVTTDSVSPISLRLFQETIPLKIADVDSSVWGRLKLVFNRKPLQDLTLRSDVSYLQAMEVDSMLFWYQTDSPWNLYANSDTLLSDTIRVPAASVDAASRKLPPLALKPLPGAATQSVTLSFNRPVQSIDTALVFLRQDTLLDKIPFRWEVDTTKHRQFLLQNNWQPRANYELSLYPGAVTDYWGVTNTDTLSKKWIGGDPKRLGNLSISFSTNDSTATYFVRLLIKGKPPVALFSLNGERAYNRQFKALPPGEYVVEVIEDTNQNQQWDTGNYSNKQQPERIVIRPLEALRANWDLEATVDLADLFQD
ncbi:MAG: Ig-like domain-containing protein [Lewinella sp.]|jgi:uncharacterized protein (DUF2141 family)|uniref:Ig-like domain-containing protein n=1 Tax=Lewinella sp. TaxID=2004506 RepID=UPI003D6C51FB